MVYLYAFNSDLAFEFDDISRNPETPGVAQPQPVFQLDNGQKYRPECLLGLERRVERFAECSVQAQPFDIRL